MSQNTTTATLDYEAKLFFNMKAIKRLEQTYTNKKLLSPEMQVVYSNYKTMQTKHSLIMNSAVSLAFTLGFLASRAPQLNRWICLGVYALLFKGVMEARNYSDCLFTTSLYDSFTVKVFHREELRRMQRAYQIKRAEAEADKKALSKYKYDP